MRSVLLLQYAKHMEPEIAVKITIKWIWSLTSEKKAEKARKSMHLNIRNICYHTDGAIFPSSFFILRLLLSYHSDIHSSCFLLSFHVSSAKAK